jgi:hypothetical protein
VKEPTNRILVKLALGFPAPGDEFHLLLKIPTECAPDEVLAGFRRHHRPCAEDGQITVQNEGTSEPRLRPQGTAHDTSTNRLLDRRLLVQLAMTWEVTQVHTLATASYLSLYMGLRSAPKGVRYLGYPTGRFDIHKLRWTVGDPRTSWSQAYLTYRAKDVPKKHNIPFAIFFLESVY